MKVSLAWLAEFVPLPLRARELGSRLTMSGFELESLHPAAPEFADVVVAEIVGVDPHPEADKLQVCRVVTDANKRGAGVQIVCGAANARVGLKTALAKVGARLPGGLAIKAAKLRGIDSQGMLCSATELGLADSSDGILELPGDAPVGMAIRDYLALDDHVIELNMTPNRGDAMSMLGVAREVAALQGTALADYVVSDVAGDHHRYLARHALGARCLPALRQSRHPGHRQSRHDAHRNA